MAPALPACATTPTSSSTSIEGRGQVLSTLQDELAEVAELQAQADTGVNEVLEVVHRVDEALDGLGAPSTLPTTLDGYDEVLTQVRDYAEAADKVAQLLERHWATYEQVDQLVADLATRPDDQPDDEAATNALVAELEPLLADLAVAPSQIAECGQERASHGRAVNDAAAELHAVLDRRPGAVTQ